MDILQPYKQLQQRHKLPKMQAGGVKVNSQAYDDPQALWEALQSQQPGQGWLMFQSAQMPFHDGLPERASDWGLLLTCEAVTNDGKSLAVVQDGRGGWRLITYVEDTNMPGLWDAVSQFAHAPDTGKLCYRRYWVDEPEQGFVQQHACFIGFE